MRINIILTIVVAVVISATAVPATADFKVQMPDAETGEFAVEPPATSARTRTAPTMAN